jgi:hypothetical protein
MKYGRPCGYPIPGAKPLTGTILIRRRIAIFVHRLSRTGGWSEGRRRLASPSGCPVLFPIFPDPRQSSGHSSHASLIIVTSLGGSRTRPQFHCSKESLPGLPPPRPTCPPVPRTRCGSEPVSCGCAGTRPWAAGRSAQLHRLIPRAKWTFGLPNLRSHRGLLRPVRLVPLFSSDHRTASGTASRPSESPHSPRLLSGGTPGRVQSRF